MKMDEKNIPIDKLWQEYKKTSSIEYRNKLAEHYAPMIKYIASRLMVYNTGDDLEDLIGYGVFGLLDAIERYDPSRDVKFETYASHRIRGAIIDNLRKKDVIPRSVRDKVKHLDVVYKQLEATSDKSVSDEDVCRYLGISIEQLDALYADINRFNCISLDEIFVDEWNICDTESLESAYDRIELKQILSEAVSMLPDREKQLLQLYYYDGLTLKEIGKVLGISESRVSQLHTKALLQLRSRLRKMQFIAG
jgi:RNA polymerase sigma factor for flagellar operon FliA